MCSYESCKGGIERKMFGLGKGLRPYVFRLLTFVDRARDKVVLVFLRLDVEIRFFFDNVVFCFKVRFCFLRLGELIVRRFDGFRMALERFFRRVAIIE